MVKRILFFSVIVLLCGCKEEDIIKDSFLRIQTAEHSYFLKLDPNRESLQYVGSLDQIQIYMLDQANNIVGIIGIFEADLDNQQLPYTIINNVDYGYVSLSIQYLDIPVGTTYGPDDDVNFRGYTFDEMTVEITRYGSGVIGGKIGGLIKTAAGTVEEITSGEFLAALKIVENP